MLDTLPGHIGDVQQAIDSTKVNERTVVGEVLDDTLDGVAFLQLGEQFLAFCRVFRLDNRTTRNNHVVALLVELDDLELEALAFEVTRIAYRANIDERTRQECPDVVDLDREATLDTTVDHAFDNFTCFESLLKLNPGTCADRFLTGKLGLTEAVFNGIERDFDFISHRDLAFALVVLKLL